ncbi:hypothetical protein [Serratia surfactantfaciens]|uniref:hypothetical protein n=1 Tax=Serratia surfactantfaciens TaxID=2741499 RepID=UPI001E37AAB8|nr:hypothetical protein [Serratia surfactantfaciens]
MALAAHYSRGIQAATAAIQGLAGGDMAKALARASAPYLAEVIHKMTTDPATQKVNTEANLMAHTVLGAMTAAVNGSSALSGASGAAMVSSLPSRCTLVSSVRI